MFETALLVTQLPRDDEGLPRGATLMHAPESVTRRIGGDVRNTLMAGSVFALQVAHPIVGRGVAEHSQYRTDPWTRLRDIDASGRRFLWTDEAAARSEGARLRAIHRDIKGLLPDGGRYHSLDPHGYGWVHMVFLDALIRQTELFGDALDGADEQQLFLEWYEAALFLGLRDRDLPQTLDAYRARFDHAVRHELEYTSVVAHLLGDRLGPPAPPLLLGLPRGVWAAIWRPLGVTSQWLALACLPRAFRERLHAEHPWRDADDVRLERLGAAVRAVVPRLPTKLRVLPVARASAKSR